jgi:carboxypeptidase Taq
MEAMLLDLKNRLAEIDDLNSASALLFWDQSTYMPPGGAEARGRQLATLGRLAHEKFVDPAIGQLLDTLESEAYNLAYDSDDAALLRLTRRQYDRATLVPSSFVSESLNHEAAIFSVWTTARPANNFAAVAPLLEKTLDLSRQYASYFPNAEAMIDPLIDLSDYGMKASTVSALFDELRSQLIPLVQAISEKPQVDDSCLRGHFPADAQKRFGEDMIARFGYDFQRGRQDATHHPFMTKFSLGDVRITTRWHEDDVSEGLFSTLHEAGHALYEQGIDPSYEGTPLAEGTSAGVHESQSRLWENLVGRSRGFWTRFYPDLQATFPDQLGNTSLDTFYRAINKVQPSLIRTAADEVTYNLHVMMRFQFEQDLLNGKLAIRDLPEAWRARMQSDLGVTPPDDRDGVLQDVHWFGGYIGGSFQGYTLGNIMSGQIYEAALQAHPSIPDQISAGEFGTLHEWLREKIYRHGSKFTAAEIIEQATGKPLSIDPYIAYLRNKYGEIYAL